MSQNSSHNPVEPPRNRPWLGIILPIWVLASFMLVQVVIAIVFELGEAAGLSVDSLNESVRNTTLSAVIYVLTIAWVIVLPRLIGRHRTTRQELGLTQLPRWLDILVAPPALLVYFVLSALLASLAPYLVQLLPFVDLNQAQDVGFDGLQLRYEYILAFLTLVVIAPIAEEILFRGYLLGKLRKHVPVWVAVVLTSLTFAIAHMNWAVGIDVFALSIILCLLRIATRSLWAPMLVHMMKNALAFYLLFVNPSLLGILGG